MRSHCVRRRARAAIMLLLEAVLLCSTIVQCLSFDFHEFMSNPEMLKFSANLDDSLSFASSSNEMASRRRPDMFSSMKPRYYEYDLMSPFNDEPRFMSYDMMRRKDNAKPKHVAETPAEGINKISQSEKLEYPPKSNLPSINFVPDEQFFKYEELESKKIDRSSRKPVEYKDKNAFGEFQNIYSQENKNEPSWNAPPLGLDVFKLNNKLSYLPTISPSFALENDTYKDKKEPLSENNYNQKLNLNKPAEYYAYPSYQDEGEDKSYYVPKKKTQSELPKYYADHLYNTKLEEERNYAKKPDIVEEEKAINGHQYRKSPKHAEPAVDNANKHKSEEEKYLDTYEPYKIKDPDNSKHKYKAEYANDIQHPQEQNANNKFRIIIDNNGNNKDDDKHAFIPAGIHQLRPSTQEKIVEYVKTHFPEDEQKPPAYVPAKDEKKYRIQIGNFDTLTDNLKSYVEEAFRKPDNRKPFAQPYQQTTEEPFAKQHQEQSSANDVAHNKEKEELLRYQSVVEHTSVAPHAVKVDPYSNRGNLHVRRQKNRENEQNQKEQTTEHVQSITPKPHNVKEPIYHIREYPYDVRDQEHKEREKLYYSDNQQNSVKERPQNGRDNSYKIRRRPHTTTQKPYESEEHAHDTTEGTSRATEPNYKLKDDFNDYTPKMTEATPEATTAHYKVTPSPVTLTQPELKYLYEDLLFKQNKEEGLRYQKALPLADNQESKDEIEKFKNGDFIYQQHDHRYMHKKPETAQHMEEESMSMKQHANHQGDNRQEIKNHSPIRMYRPKHREQNNYHHKEKTEEEKEAEMLDNLYKQERKQQKNRFTEQDVVHKPQKLKEDNQYNEEVTFKPIKHVKYEPYHDEEDATYKPLYSKFNQEKPQEPYEHKQQKDNQYPEQDMAYGQQEDDNNDDAKYADNYYKHQVYVRQPENKHPETTLTYSKPDYDTDIKFIDPFGFYRFENKPQFQYPDADFTYKQPDSKPDFKLTEPYSIYEQQDDKPEKYPDPELAYNNHNKDVEPESEYPKPEFIYRSRAKPSKQQSKAQITTTQKTPNEEESEEEEVKFKPKKTLSDYTTKGSSTPQPQPLNLDFKYPSSNYEPQEGRVKRGPYRLIFP